MSQVIQKKSNQATFLIKLTQNETSERQQIEMSVVQTNENLMLLVSIHLPLIR